MKIAIIAAGTRGDIQPCVALAKGLKNMNIEVIFATYAEYKDLVLNNSIEYRELPENPANKWEANNKKRIKFSDQMEYFGKIWLKKSLDICSNCDAVVYTTLFFLGNHPSHTHNFSTLFQPLTIFFPATSSNYPEI